MKVDSVVLTKRPFIGGDKKNLDSIMRKKIEYLRTH